MKAFHERIRWILSRPINWKILENEIGFPRCKNIAWFWQCFEKTSSFFVLKGNDNESLKSFVNKKFSSRTGPRKTPKTRKYMKDHPTRSMCEIFGVFFEGKWNRKSTWKATRTREKSNFLTKWFITIALRVWIIRHYWKCTEGVNKSFLEGNTFDTNKFPAKYPWFGWRRVQAGLSENVGRRIFLCGRRRGTFVGEGVCLFLFSRGVKIVFRRGFS